jgi:hypothetical protein
VAILDRVILTASEGIMTDGSSGPGRNCQSLVRASRQWRQGGGHYQPITIIYAGLSLAVDLSNIYKEGIEAEDNSILLIN